MLGDIYYDSYTKEPIMRFVVGLSHLKGPLLGFLYRKESLLGLFYKGSY